MRENGLQLQLLRRLAMLCLICVGCFPKFADYPMQSFKQYALSAVTEQVAVAIDPFIDDRRVKIYFGKISRGLLPIYVRIENRDPETAILVQRENFSLSSTADGMNSSNRQPTPSDTQIAAVPADRVLLPRKLWSPLFGFGPQAESTQSSRDNLGRKELQPQTLRFGETADGFLYFRLPEDRRGAEEWVFRVDMPRVGTSGDVVILLPLELKAR